MHHQCAFIQFSCTMGWARHQAVVQPTGSLGIGACRGAPVHSPLVKAYTLYQEDVYIGRRKMAQPYVLAFIGENANGIVKWWTQQILNAFARRGLSHHLIDLCGDDSSARLADCLSGGNPAFCFSFQGMGMDFSLNGENYWSLNSIPFFSYLGDSPYQRPALHAAEGAGLYMLYGCEDFLQVYQRHLKGRAYATVLRYGYPANPVAHQTAWAKRRHDIVFVKTAVDPKSILLEWSTLPTLLRTLLHDTSERVLTGVDETIAAICAQAFADRLIHFGDRQELFLSTCSAVDRYVRAVRAERMVRALLPQNALILGDWSYLDKPSARARFWDSLPANRLDDLYAESRIVVSTSPSVRYGMHERVMGGLLAKAFVLSDTTPYLQTLLQGCPGFLGCNIDQPGLSNEVDQAIKACLSDPLSAEKAEISIQMAENLFSFDRFIEQFFDHVALEQRRQAVKDWSFPSATQHRAAA